MLRAIADAAGHDPEVERVYHGLIERFVAATTARIEDDLARRPVAGLDAAPTAGALVWMSERYLLMTLGRLPKEPVDTVVERSRRSGCARSTQPLLVHAHVTLAVVAAATLLVALSRLLAELGFGRAGLGGGALA